MDRRDEFLLASKTGIIVDGSRRGIDCSPLAMTASIEGSLKRLRTDHIDLFYMHRFDPKVPIADSVGALAGALGSRLALADKDLRARMPRFNEEHWPRNMQLICAFNALAKDAGVTPAQLSTAWVLSRGRHLHAIPGTTNLAHLAENFATCDMEVDSDVLLRVGEIVNQQTVSGHRYPEVIRGTIDTEDF